eukprot:CAMPEP_0168292974 /NCGR_PEP_ID=MMETSP0142_2-20121227/7557_1 /TAXON_ID=44445 /ORGANISM="Pseudo-nitzschia australis, Strain 10249 10 AB" /LENGTH=137 /DNA_ID=CAMNT_0008240943 /DNA_START=381 /DNA_END=791 /DNA_ORIENTATION=-
MHDRTQRTDGRFQWVGTHARTHARLLPFLEGDVSPPSIHPTGNKQTTGAERGAARRPPHTANGVRTDPELLLLLPAAASHHGCCTAPIPGVWVCSGTHNGRSLRDARRDQLVRFGSFRAGVAVAAAAAASHRIARRG